MCPACGFTAYASSVPTVCAVCVDDEGRVLLARRAGEPFRGYWDLPGGFLNEGEHPLDAVRRELLEETGLEVAPEAFLGVWMDRYGNAEGDDATMNLYWTRACSAVGWRPPTTSPRSDGSLRRRSPRGTSSHSTSPTS